MSTANVLDYEIAATERDRTRQVTSLEEDKVNKDIPSVYPTMPRLPPDHSDGPGEEGMGDEQELGALKMEALYLVFGRGWKLFMLWGSIAIIAYVYALSQSTTYTYLQIATSSFGTHTVTATIGVITAIMAGVIKPFLAKLSDLTSRPLAIALSVCFFGVGYAMVAGAQNVDTLAAGQVIYTVGNTGIDFILGIIMADITPLQWRGAINGAFSLPFIPNAFIAGYITDGVSAYSANGWRWGYGMFAILVPVCIAPAIAVLFWGHRQADKLGALSLASSSYARRKQMQLKLAEQNSDGSQTLPDQGRRVDLSRYCAAKARTLLFWLHHMDALGLILLGFAFALLLSPATLSATATGGYKNRSLIAMYAVGGVLFILFCVWEWRFARFPIMPRRVMNRSFLCSVGIDFMYYLSGYVPTYFLSWVYVTKGYSTNNYVYFSNILTVGLCLFGFIAGLAMRYTHRYKWIQLFGLCIRCVGMGLQFGAANGNHSDVNLVFSEILISIGGGCSVVGSQIAVQASVPHRDMAIALALLSLWTSIGGSIGSAIGAAIWNKWLPIYLKQYLGATHTDAQLQEMFESILVAAVAEPRGQVIKAYDSVAYIYQLTALVLSFTSLICGVLTSNFHLGTTHNAIEDHEIVIHKPEEVEEEVVRERVAQAEAEARRVVESRV